MTQRIRLDGTEETPRPVNPRRDRNKKRWYMTKGEKITLISLGSITLVLLVAAIIMISSMFAAPADDGKILKGVVAAGVHLGGMTKEEATIALQDATANTYTRLDMTVEVWGEKIALTPLKTGARLNIAAVVEEAYNYGRTGSRSERNEAKNNALSNSVSIDIIPYLNLNTSYIKEEINKLGEKFSTPLEDPSILRIEGAKPSMDVSKPDTDKAQQIMYIYTGTAEYHLNTDKLYNQVLEYYNTNIFKVVDDCKVDKPKSIEDELVAQHALLYVEPQDAIEHENGDITPEKYGYGFDLDAAKEKLAQASYGETIPIELKYIKPAWTEEMIASGLYKDILGDYSSYLTQGDNEDLAWNNNATLACQKLNGLVIKPGETFSFNKLLGALTEEGGYLEALTDRGSTSVIVIGGGVTHTASVLYNCVLAAELEILEYHCHAHAPGFIEVGRDAYVDGDKADFRFKNNSADPIKIMAEIVNNRIYIRIEGIDTRDYYVSLSTETTVILPGTLYNYMLPDNVDGYVDGDELFAGVNGYEVKVQLTQISKDYGQILDTADVCTVTYAPQDAVVVKLTDAPTVPPVTGPEPSEPTTPTGPTTTPTTPTTPPTTGPATN